AAFFGGKEDLHCRGFLMPCAHVHRCAASCNVIRNLITDFVRQITVTGGLIHTARAQDKSSGATQGPRGEGPSQQNFPLYSNSRYLNFTSTSFAPGNNEVTLHEPAPRIMPAEQSLSLTSSGGSVLGQSPGTSGSVTRLICTLPNTVVID